MKAIARVIAMIYCLMCIPLYAEPSDVVIPFQSRTQHPLLLQFLSLLPTSPYPLKKGHLRASTQTVHSNLLERDTEVDLDMEIWRSSFLVEYGITDEMDIAVEMPLLHASAGFLDGFIQNYHDAFGFPNGGREDVPNNRFSYRIAENGTTLYSVSPIGFAMSDWTLAAKLHLLDIHGVALAFQPLLKLPFGQPEGGTGSGNVDAGFSVISGKRWHWVGITSQAGFIIVGEHEPLESLMQSAALQWVQTFDFRLRSNLALLVQWQGTTPPFKNRGTTALDGAPLDLIIGFSGTGLHSPSGHLFWQVAFGEDPLGTGPSVDFSSYVRLGYEL